MSAVAGALDVKLTAQGEPLANLVRVLGGMQALLVFDNCEHLVDPVSEIILEVLQRCQNVKILTTSRQPLGISGEETYRLPSLETPTEGNLEELQAGDAMGFPAIALFVERARAVDERFCLSAENAVAIAEICRRLDGIPLAIELAATRVTILSPNQLREHLSSRFDVLTTTSQNALPRHRTLRALIDWSHDLLTF